MSVDLKKAGVLDCGYLCALRSIAETKQHIKEMEETEECPREKGGTRPFLV